MRPRRSNGSAISAAATTKETVIKVLAVCDQGNNRSVHIAHLIKYFVGLDVLACGLKTNSPGTLDMLFKWADRIITTDPGQRIPEAYGDKVQLWNVGPDVYKRPFNHVLLAKVRKLIETHRSELEAGK